MNTDEEEKKIEAAGEYKHRGRKERSIAEHEIFIRPTAAPSRDPGEGGRLDRTPNTGSKYLI